MGSEAHCGPAAGGQGGKSQGVLAVNVAADCMEVEAQEEEAKVEEGRAAQKARGPLISPTTRTARSTLVRRQHRRSTYHSRR